METPLRVLLIEDSESDAALVIRQLEKADYAVTVERVETAAQMTAALEKQAWDCVIADYQLPQFDAPAALAVLQATGLDLPFIVVSGTIGEETAVALMKAGAHDYLMKDKLARLAPAVKRELAEAQSRRERRQAEKHFQSLIENAPDGIVLVTIDGKFKYISPSARRIFGYGADEAVTGGALESTHPADLPAVLTALNNLIQDPAQVPALQYRFQHRDGAWRWIESTFSNLLAEPSVEAIVINFHDITDRRRAEEALRESEERFQQLFATSPDAIVLINPHDANAAWPIVDCNEAACQMNGYTREELLGQSIDILNQMPEIREERLAYLDRVRREGVIHVEAFHRHQDGHVFPVEVSTSLFTFEGRELVLGIDRDITERKQAEEALQENARQLKETQFIAGLGSYRLDFSIGQWASSDVLDTIFGIDETFERSVAGWAALIHPDDRQHMIDYLTNEVIGKRLSSIRNTGSLDTTTGSNAGCMAWANWDLTRRTNPPGCLARFKISPSANARSGIWNCWPRPGANLVPRSTCDIFTPRSTALSSAPCRAIFSLFPTLAQTIS